MSVDGHVIAAGATFCSNLSTTLLTSRCVKPKTITEIMFDIGNHVELALKFTLKRVRIFGSFELKQVTVFNMFPIKDIKISFNINTF